MKPASKPAKGPVRDERPASGESTRGPATDLVDGLQRAVIIEREKQVFDLMAENADLRQRVERLTAERDNLRLDLDAAAASHGKTLLLMEQAIAQAVAEERERITKIIDGRLNEVLPETNGQVWKPGYLKSLVEFRAWVNPEAAAICAQGNSQGAAGEAGR